MKSMLPLITGLVAISGCASTASSKVSYAVEYDSTPQSATLVCQGKQQGYTPMTLRYKVSSQIQAFALPPCKAVWKSGAAATYETQIDRRTHRYRQTLLVQRPDAIPGIAEDIDFDYRKKNDDRTFDYQRARDEKVLGQQQEQRRQAEDMKQVLKFIDLLQAI